MHSTTNMYNDLASHALAPKIRMSVHESKINVKWKCKTIETILSGSLATTFTFYDFPSIR